MSSKLNGVQAKIKKDKPEGMILHCYVHITELGALTFSKMYACV